ncbi:MAG TPA: hypoxanthine phosphoribosyltransferase [Candidatus Krumholzibacteria bacterium]|nr:hypoxanthine phosphoribosyltransferase [Candidatus Krumholzibacteria bacterium]
MSRNHPDHPSPGQVLVTAAEIDDIVARLGREISRDYSSRHPVLISLLKGGVVFLADLIRHLTIPHHIEFMRVSSYESTRSTGAVRIISDLDTSIEGRDVLLVEDVIDTGTTLAYIVDMLRLRNPGSLEVCALLRKRVASRPAGIPIRYLGHDIPDTFVVGYGLDHDENYRNLPFIAALDPSLGR